MFHQQPHPRGARLAQKEELWTVSLAKEYLLLYVILSSRMRERHDEEREALEKKMELERELERKETLLEVMHYEEAKDAEI